MDYSSEDLIYNIAINMVPGLGGSGVRSLVSQCGSARQIFENLGDLAGSGIIKQRVADSIKGSGALRLAQEQAEICQKHKISILYYQDRAFPRKLAACDGAPALIYTLGSINFDATRTVGIVGTRSSDSDGKANIFALVEQLREHNINAVIISGLALGADTYAHQASLKFGMPTAAVLGHGLNMVYPAENRRLAGDIVHAGGALVTEYYFGQPVSKTNFPRRNRIIAGLCDALVVAQSKQSGGALITAGVARELRKEIFAFPGRVSDKLYAGCNQLISDNIATLIASAADLEKHMGWAPRGTAVQTEMRLEPLSEAEARILDILHSEGATGIDTLSAISGMAMHALSSTLLTMEFKDLVAELPGKRYEAR